MKFEASAYVHVREIPHSFNFLGRKSKQYFIYLKNNNTLSPSPIWTTGHWMTFLCDVIRAAAFKK